MLPSKANLSDCHTNFCMTVAIRLSTQKFFHIRQISITVYKNFTVRFFAFEFTFLFAYVILIALKSLITDDILRLQKGII